MRASRIFSVVLLCATAAACVGEASRDAGDAGSSPPADAEADAYVPPGADGGVGPTGDASTGPDGGTGPGPVGPTGPLVDPTCTDGMFTEILPDSDASIDDLVEAYTPEGAEMFLLGVLDRRYPTGALLVEGGRIGAQSCLDYFLRDTSSAGAVLGQLDVIVHECGHFYDLSMGTATYALNDMLQISCGGGATFARSELYDDAFSAERPPCNGGFIGCDRYADTYLDPASDGGHQGFDMVFEEAVQYVHSLASGLAITHELGGSSRTTSHRDGILTFLWYVQRYLHMARIDHPETYTHLLEGDGGCWREAILTVWGQAWLYLEATREMDHLGIEDDQIEALVEDPVLLDEIERLRAASGC